MLTLFQYRSLTLTCALVCTVCNSFFAVRLLALWRSLGWESESEWEGSIDVWRVDSVKIVWGLLFSYFAAAAVACFIGFYGVVKNLPSFVRFYRDYSFADFVFITVSTLFVSYATFSTHYVRTTVCEEFSRHPELMRDMVQMGLNLENCELWFDRAVFVCLGLMFMVIVIRLHVLLALLKYYHNLTRDRFAASKLHTGLRLSTDGAQRIYLLPTPTSPSSSSMPFNYNTQATLKRNEDEVIVFAPVPVGGMSEQDAREMNATEAWIPARPESGSSTPRSHKHSHSHSHSHSHRHHVFRAGSIRLEDGRGLGDEKDSAA
ncbi:hypothetical protein B0H21DRAFT_684433 [Amylocystis lapponica]|nr:hypothetical protein B0H21DRAFT_684433 [Amylocystis lapponica]